MPDQTLSHLLSWIDHQFGSDNYVLTSEMMSQYGSDPELYERAGWWRCHDDMIAAGHSTL